MGVIRTESRCRIGITWYATEQEADAVARALTREYGREAIENANIGFAQCGRAPAFDQPGEYAVVTP